MKDRSCKSWVSVYPSRCSGQATLKAPKSRGTEAVYGMCSVLSRAESGVRTVRAGWMGTVIALMPPSAQTGTGLFRGGYSGDISYSGLFRGHHTGFCLSASSSMVGLTCRGEADRGLAHAGYILSTRWALGGWASGFAVWGNRVCAGRPSSPAGSK